MKNARKDFKTLKFTSRKSRGIVVSEHDARILSLYLFVMKENGRKANIKLWNHQNHSLLWCDLHAFPFFHSICRGASKAITTFCHIYLHFITREKSRNTVIWWILCALPLRLCASCIPFGESFYDLPNWWIRQRKNWDHVYLIRIVLLSPNKFRTSFHPTRSPKYSVVKMTKCTDEYWNSIKQSFVYLWVGLCVYSFSMHSSLHFFATNNQIENLHTILSCGNIKKFHFF